MDQITCTVKDAKECGPCTLNSELHCRWNKNILNGFIAVASPSFVGTLVLLAIIYLITSQWWPIVAYLVLVIVFFGYEIKFLCSHCPYYVGEGKSLKCLGNNGAPKVWKYNPAPLTKGEKILMKLLIATFYIIIPALVSLLLIWLVYSGRYDLVTLGFAIGTFIFMICSSAVFFQIMKTYYCSRCVNFSCPLNTVEKRIVDEYLSKNDVMREAWEKNGYRLG